MFLTSQTPEDDLLWMKKASFWLFKKKNFYRFALNIFFYSKLFGDFFHEVQSKREQHSNARVMVLIEAIIHATMASFGTDCRPPLLLSIIIYCHPLFFICCPLHFTITHCCYPFFLSSVHLSLPNVVLTCSEERLLAVCYLSAAATGVSRCTMEKSMMWRLDGLKVVFAVSGNNF